MHSHVKISFGASLSQYTKLEVGPLDFVLRTFGHVIHAPLRMTSEHVIDGGKNMAEERKDK